MNRILAIVLLVVGVALLFWGYQESETLTSEASEMVTGEPTDNAMWFLISGAIIGVIGLYGLLRGK